MKSGWISVAGSRVRMDPLFFVFAAVTSIPG